MSGFSNCDDFFVEKKCNCYKSNCCPCSSKCPTYCYVGPAGPQGPMGPQGEQGIQGPVGPRGEQGIAGSQGIQGPVGPQGERGATGIQGEQGPIGPQGIQGPVGPQGTQGLAGPQGEQGIQGATGPQGESGQDGTGVSILGSYDTFQDLVNAHPTGNPGDAYLVQGDLYVWNEVDSMWTNVGNIQGPAGPAGPQGEQGPAGIQGTQGEQGPAGPQGEQGPIGPQGEQGPIGPQGVQGERGPQGLQGSIGPQGIEGSVGPAGPQGEQGPMGPQGMQGVAGGGTIIPVAANASITPSTNSSGLLTTTRLLGFGNASGYVTVAGGTTFTLNADDEFVVFTMPYDGIITTVAGQYSTVAVWTAPSDMRLYIAVAVAPAGSNTFTIIEQSKALAMPYVLSQTYPNREARYGIAEDLGIYVSKGERIAILTGYNNTGGTVAQTLPFNFTGSISIDRI